MIKIGNIREKNRCSKGVTAKGGTLPKGLQSPYTGSIPWPLYAQIFASDGQRPGGGPAADPELWVSA